MPIFEKLRKLLTVSDSPENRRRYYELWGDVVAQNYTLRILVAGCLLVIVVLGSSIAAILRRPPVVVRVTDVGKAEINRDLTVNNAPDEVELRAFVREFLSAYAELDSATVVADMTRALNMMTRQYQKIHEEEIKKQGLIRKIQEAGIKTRLEILHIGFRNSGSKIHASVAGIARVYPSGGDNTARKTNGFRSHLVLRKVPRTDLTPNGLLVDAFQNETVDVGEIRDPDPELSSLKSQIEEETERSPDVEK